MQTADSIHLQSKLAKMLLRVLQASGLYSASVMTSFFSHWFWQKSIEEFKISIFS